MVSAVALTRYAEQMSLPSNRIFASKTVFPRIFRASAGKLIYSLSESLFFHAMHWKALTGLGCLPVCRDNLTARSARFIGRNFLWIISPLRRLFINFSWLKFQNEHNYLLFSPNIWNFLSTFVDKTERK